MYHLSDYYTFVNEFNLLNQAWSYQSDNTGYILMSKWKDSIYMPMVFYIVKGRIEILNKNILISIPIFINEDSPYFVLDESHKDIINFDFLNRNDLSTYDVYKIDFEYDINDILEEHIPKWKMLRELQK